MVLNKCVGHLILFHPIYRPRHASHVLSKQMANLTKDKSYFVRFSARSIVLRCKSEKLGLRGILKRLNPSCARRHFPDDKFYKTLSLPTGAPVICKFEQSLFLDADPRINPFMSNGITRPYHLDESISNLWVVGW